MLKTAKTPATYYGRKDAAPEDIGEAAQHMLPHRVRRQPLQEIIHDVGRLRRPRGRVLENALKILEDL